MPEYILTGDVSHPGRVIASGETLQEAIENAEDGHFEVWDEEQKYGLLEFEFCGDTDGGVEEC